MALILSIETATTVCSVAIHKEGKLQAKQSLYLNQSHSSLLSPVIHTLLQYAGHKLKDLSAIALSKGPGSYTGLRIGTSTAKGLCYALDIPLISINTLEAMAAQVTNLYKNDHLFCPMIDARRMEVYSAVVDNHIDIILETQPVIIDENSFEDLLDKRSMIFFGNGAEKCKGVINHQNAFFIDNITPEATTIGELGYKQYVDGNFEDLAYFEPFYLKEFMATKPKNVT